MSNAVSSSVRLKAIRASLDFDRSSRFRRRVATSSTAGGTGPIQSSNKKKPRPAARPWRCTKRNWSPPPNSSSIPISPTTRPCTPNSPEPSNGSVPAIGLTQVQALLRHYERRAKHIYRGDSDVGVHVECGSGAGGKQAVDRHLPDRRRVVRAPRERRADARQQWTTTARASSTGGIFKKVVKHNPRSLDLSTITHHPARSTMYHQSRPNLTSASNLPIIPLPLSPESSTLSFHHRKPSPSTPSRATISSIKPLHRLPLL
ncbi:hypothetical protein PCASD_10001 [Puccinia coronata f. sp. avenae]|uniref:Uncharacterized protein n=1 Tax=Puccinia coronata f. sp. avenae TaxID=200324 RepID=A0A2N5UVA4_9BASI|nr:hypothetical protein PCASD_10001 [Puccinia coronata f. sp. avenae]